jgi:sensor histidine kinase YesM
MTIVDFIYVLRFTGLLLLIVCTDSSADQQPSNILTSNKSIQLRQWQITKDPTPQSIFHNPSDSLWLPLKVVLNDGKYDVGNWMIRTEIVIDDSVNRETTWGLFVTNISSAYEVYWDRHKIAQNGSIGISRGNEYAGQYDYRLILPASLVTVGKHTLVLRVSHYHNYAPWKWYYGACIIGSYDTELKNIFQRRYQAFFVLGILCIPFLMNLFLYFARENRIEHLLFSLICGVVIVDSGVSVIPILTEVSTTYIQWEYTAYQIITFLFACLFPAFFVRLFSFPKKSIWFVIVLNLIIYVFFTSLLNMFSVMSLTVLGISSIIALAALVKRREGSLIICIGLIAAWGAYYFDVAFAGLATVMVICTSISLAQQFGRKERAEKEAQLRSAHLENELLKKNINPHFLLNTLTSIIAWFRKDPKSAVKLVEALAEEFRMILQISTLKQIPIQQEIDLCKAHLKIMSYRKGAEYVLETVNITEDENVPPMIFHTLIENGLTHGFENKNKGTFTLQRRRNMNGVLYILSHDGDFDSDNHKGSTGFGMRYIKSRLEESYPHRWEITSHRQAQGWETIIEIRDK